MAPGPPHLDANGPASDLTRRLRLPPATEGRGRHDDGQTNFQDDEGNGCRTEQPQPDQGDGDDRCDEDPGGHGAPPLLVPILAARVGDDEDEQRELEEEQAEAERPDGFEHLESLTFRCGARRPWAGSSK